jgi:hypothetical protein
MLDNGAFSVWRRGAAMDWRAWREWVELWLDYRTTWCVLPDLIDGGEAENDALLREFDLENGAPVWHLHEDFSRLVRLADLYPRICFGSSGAYATVGSVHWHRRVSEAFDTLIRTFGSVPWVHMLRGMSMSGGPYPFASVDSTDIARNHHLPHKSARAMADRWDGLQCPASWIPLGTQIVMEVA